MNVNSATLAQQNKTIDRQMIDRQKEIQIDDDDRQTIDDR